MVPVEIIEQIAQAADQGDGLYLDEVDIKMLARFLSKRHAAPLDELAIFRGLFEIQGTKLEDVAEAIRDQEAETGNKVQSILIPQPYFQNVPVYMVPGPDCVCISGQDYSEQLTVNMQGFDGPLQ